MPKLIILSVFIMIPIICRSQYIIQSPENFLGKSKKEIINYFKVNGFKYSYTFDNSDKEELIFNYNRNKKCVMVIKALKLSAIDSVKNVLNNYFDKKDTEIFSGVWADKAKTFKVHVETEKIIDRLLLEYVSYNTPYRVY